MISSSDILKFVAKLLLVLICIYFNTLLLFVVNKSLFKLLPSAVTTLF
jgi:hypothetical protein